MLEGLESDNPEAVIDTVRDSVKALCARFPVYAADSGKVGGY